MMVEACSGLANANMRRLFLEDLVDKDLVNTSNLSIRTLNEAPHGECAPTLSFSVKEGELLAPLDACGPKLHDIGHLIVDLISSSKHGHEQRRQRCVRRPCRQLKDLTTVLGP